MSLAAVSLAALVLLGGSSHAQTDPIAGAQALHLFRTSGITRIGIQPPPTFSTYAMIWGTQPVGSNAVIYGHGYTSPAQLRLTNSSTTINDVLRMSDDTPPVPGWYPRNLNIWVTNGGNPVLGGTYVSSGELGAAPDAGSNWFGTTNTWPIYLVAGASPNNVVRGVMSANGVLSLDSALSVGRLSASDSVSITNDSVPSSMMVRSPSIIRVQNINMNSGTDAAPIWSTRTPDSNTIVGAAVFTGTPRSTLNTLLGAGAFSTQLLAGQSGSHPTTNPLYFSGIRNTAMGYRAGYRGDLVGLQALFGANVVSLNTTTNYAVGDVGFGSSALARYRPSAAAQSQFGFTPANPSRIAPNTAIGAWALAGYDNAAANSPYNIAVGVSALRTNQTARGNIALGYKSATLMSNNSVSDALYISNDSTRNFLMMGALSSGRFHINAPHALYGISSALDPNQTDGAVFVYANTDSDEDGSLDPTPLNQYSVPDAPTILSPSTMDPTLRLTVPEVLPPNMNDNATRGVRTGGTTAQVIDGNRAPAVGATLPAWVNNQWVGYRVLITSGPQAGQIREISANTGNVLTVDPVWSPAIAANSKYAILPSFLETERNALGTVQFGVPNFQLDLQGNVHMRPYGPGTGEDAAFGQVAEMRLYDLTNFEIGQQTTGTSTTLTDASKSWPSDIYANAIVRILEGTGAGQTRRVTSNTNTTLTVATAFSPPLDNTSKYEIEIVEETGTATLTSSSSITDATKNWTAEFLDFTGAQIRITGGLGAGQTRTVLSNTSNIVNVFPPFTTIPNTTSTYSISRWFPRYVGFRAANDVPNTSWNVFMNLPAPTAIPVGARYALTITNDAPLTLGWVGVGSMAFPHTWDNKSANIGEPIDVSLLFGWPAAGYPFGSTGTAEQSLIMGKKLTLNGPPAVPFASRVPQANFTTGFGFRVMNSLDAETNAGDSNAAIGARAMFSATTGERNIAIGKDALRLLTTGSENVAVGVNALSSLVTGSRSVAVGANALRSSVATTGANTAIGESAMELLTTGEDNTAVGSKSMRSATTAARNVVIGDNAASALTIGTDNVIAGATAAPALTSGTNNVLVGANAAPLLSTGNSNLVIGNQALAAATNVNNMVAISQGALQTLTGGTQNVAIGRFTMQNAVNASFNIAIGDEALRNLSTGANNVAIGSSALKVLTTGSDNIAIGESAMPFLTTGSENVAIGRRALRSNVSANRNIALGQDALTLLTSGSENIAAGSQALAALVNGSNNIAIGRSALSSLATGSDFVAVGNNAMLSVTGGAIPSIALGVDALRSMVTSDGTNIAVGLEALYSALTSYDNIAIGARALRNLVSGAGRNIAIGNAALRDLTTGADNVAIGESALPLLSSASSNGNVALGANAMSAATNASQNVAVGSSALSSMTDGQSNVAIGRQAMLSSTTTLNNVAVGFQALASNTTGRDNVAVGTQTMAGSSTGPMFSNVAVGTFAMQSYTAGAANTAVGASALLGLTTGGEIDSGNVALGNLAGARAPSGTKNALFIANNEGTALLFGRFGAGRLMINATLPISGPLPTLNAALQVNSNAATDRGVIVRMAAAPTVSPMIIQNDLEATTFEIQTSGAFPSIAGVSYTWPGAAPAAAAAGTQTGRAAFAASSAGALSFRQLTATVVTAPLNLPVVNANASADIVVPNAVVGAAPGDVVALGVPNAAANLNLVSYHAWVSANDQVTIRVNNFSANALAALNNQVFRVVVVK